MSVENTILEYREFIPGEKGFIFKYNKTDNEFIHTYAEGNLLKRMGLTPAMIVGKKLVDFLPEQIAQKKVFYYEKAWGGMTVNYEGYLQGVYYLATLNPIRKNGQVVEVIATAYDTTEEKRKEIHIQKLEKLSVAGELAAGIAHEIRNPLTSIKGFAQIVKGSVNNKDLEGYLEIMLDELERINEIVNDFMLIAKPKGKLNIKSTNINDLLVNVIKFMEPQSNLKSIILNCHFHSTIVADCDTDQIRQILINILQNAIEATNDSTKHIDIVLKNVSNQEYLIQIIDKGQGISEERQKKLYEPFFSTKEKGIGLGLMICKRIIENHNGKIDIQSNQGEGTVVTIYLPKRVDYLSAIFTS